MANGSDTQGLLLQNLQDAGCDNDLINTCMSLVLERKAGEMLWLLSQHKRTLLERVHTYQKEIDCLDYLIYRINKNEY